MQTLFSIPPSTTDQQIVVPDPQGNAIKVIAMILESGSNTNFTLNTQTGAGAGVAISPTFQNSSSDETVLEAYPDGWFSTNNGDGLTGTTGTGQTVSGYVIYKYAPK